MTDKRDSDILAFGRSLLEVDPGREVERIAAALQGSVHRRLRRKGAAVAISGGLDSSVVLAICAKAFGPDRVIGLILPEDDSHPDSAALARLVATQFGVRHVTENITAALEGFGCYRRRDEAIRRLFPEFGPGWKARLTIPGNLLESDTLNVFHLSVVDPQGKHFSRRLPPDEYFQVVAASNFKQRCRMSMLYYHAERKHFAAVGTGNKNEHALGFFVKHGDGGVDVQPIAHLFKSQVYQLGRHLQLPREILERAPTTDTYSGGGTQEEFFFRLPFDVLDQVWLGYEKNLPTARIAAALDLSVQQVDRIIADLVRKMRTTEYLRTAPILFSSLDSSEAP